MEHISKSINHLLQVMDITVYDNEVKNEIDNIVFSFNPEVENDYFNAIDIIYGKDKELKETLSRSAVADRLNIFLKELILKKLTCTEKLLKEFFEKLKKILIEERTVFREIHGIRIVNEPIITNGFELYNILKHKETLDAKYPQFINEIEKGYIQVFQTKNVICCKVKTRDYNKAQELAIERFREFENVLNFFICNVEFKNWIRISESNIFQPSVTIITSKTSRTTTVESSEFGVPSLLSNQIFKTENFQYLFKLITKKNKSDIESRIATAVDWSSNGLKQKNKSKALIYIVFAIESLLKSDKKGIINPSIVSQISDTVGFIIGSDCASRMKYAKQFSQLYGKRSEVVHYGKDKVSQVELNSAYFIYKSVITKFIESDELKELKNTDNLFEWYRMKKFS